MREMAFDRERIRSAGVDECPDERVRSAGGGAAAFGGREGDYASAEAISAR
ncbi:hypothetical protein GFS60_04991 [Rhodococcus sp. WAY2]|nr:hypothetical protein GFS60_04991 [Rhodococcus sp. WAY2]